MPPCGNNNNNKSSLRRSTTPDPASMRRSTSAANWQQQNDDDDDDDNIRPHHTACWSKWRLQRWRQIVGEHLWQLLNAILHSILHPTCNTTTTNDGSVMLLRATNWFLSNCQMAAGLDGGEGIINGRSNSSTIDLQH
ncbi:hypothetical protein ACLKA6_010105 [Drosophila palustris]